MTVVLVINSGSSSFKYQLLDMSTETTLAAGLVERIGEGRGAFRDRQPLVDVGRDDGLAQHLGHGRPGPRPVVLVDDHDPAELRLLGPRGDLLRRVARAGQDDGGAGDLADGAQREVLEGGTRADELLDEGVGRRREDLLGCAELLDLAALGEDQHAVAELDRLVDVVRDDDDGLVQLLLDREELVLQPHAGDGVHRAEGLVHEQDGRVGRQRAGDADALLLAAGHLLGEPAPEGVRVQPDEFQQLGDPGAGAGLVPAEEARHRADVLLHRPVREQAARLDDVADALAEVVGVGTEEGVDVGPLITEKARAGVQELVTDAVEHGARASTGGQVPDGPGWFYPPTVLLDVPADARLLREEIFGPVAPIVTFSTEEEALAMANDSEYGLASYVFTRDSARVVRVMEGLEFGMVGVNQGIVSNPAAPFGGVKHSGFGREGGFEGIDEYLETKYVGIAL